METEPLTTTREDAKELKINHSTVIWHLKKIEKMKKRDKWVHHELTTNKKNHSFKMLSSHILCSNFSTGLWQAMKSGLHTTTSSGVRPRRSSKALFKAKHAPKEDHGHCSVVCCQFDPLQVSESPKNHHIWEICSANRRDALKTVTPTANTGQQEGPNSSP